MRGLLLLSFLSTVLSGVPLLAEDDHVRIEIHKADRELILTLGEETHRYPIGLGFEPVADKTRQGDGATPQGEYFVCIKNPYSRYHLSLGINYPNAEDAERGLKDGLISKSQHDAIVRAQERGVCPPWNTRLGGEIFIHGNGSSADWTLGCVALDDDDMDELFAAVVVGARVVIKP